MLLLLWKTLSGRRPSRMRNCPADPPTLRSVVVVRGAQSPENQPRSLPTGTVLTFTGSTFPPKHRITKQNQATYLEEDVRVLRVAGPGQQAAVGRSFAASTATCACPGRRLVGRAAGGVGRGGGGGGQATTARQLRPCRRARRLLLLLLAVHAAGSQGATTPPRARAEEKVD